MDYLRKYRDSTDLLIADNNMCVIYCQGETHNNVISVVNLIGRNGEGHLFLETAKCTPKLNRYILMKCEILGVYSISAEKYMLHVRALVSRRDVLDLIKEKIPKYNNTHIDVHISGRIISHQIDRTTLSLDPYFYEIRRYNRLLENLPNMGRKRKPYDDLCNELGIRPCKTMKDTIAALRSFLKSAENLDYLYDACIVLDRKDKIWFSASEVAIFTGDNQYADLRDTILKYVYKNREDLMREDGVIDKREQMRESIGSDIWDSAISQKSVSPVELHEHIKNIDATIDIATSIIPNSKEICDVLTCATVDIAVKEQKIEEIREFVSDEEVAALLTGDIAEICGILNKKTLPESMIADIKAEIKGDLTCGYGIINEMSAIARYEEISGNKVHSNNNKLYRKEYSNFFICGRVDGIVGDNEMIIEVKNRRDRIFPFIPKYENVQMNVYMDIVGIDKCELVQHLDGKLDIRKIEKNADVMTNAIEKLTRASSLIHTLRNDKKEENHLLLVTLQCLYNISMYIFQHLLVWFQIYLFF